MFNNKSYIIETLTNTHMGSGDTSFGIVDKIIQKDPITFIPIFHSSSLKGAIKEHMEKDDRIKNEIKNIFGDKEDKPGYLKFYEARLVTLPLRSSRRVYYNATSPHTMINYLEALTLFDADPTGNAQKLKGLFENIAEAFEPTDLEFYIFNDDKDTFVEDYEKSKKWPSITDEQKQFFTYFTGGLSIDNLAVISDEIFKNLCSDSLPVIARNCIDEQGKSENLFYEEVLPRRSRLWFMVGFPQKNNITPVFEEKLTHDIIQMGACASIGYGATMIKKTGGTGE
jgi:CRISPR-associated protein Cmr4